MIVEMALNDGIQGLEKLIGGGADDFQLLVCHAVVPMPAIVVSTLLVGRNLGQMIFAPERIQMHLAGLYSLVDIDLDGVCSYYVGVRKVAVKTRHTLLAHDGIVAFIVDFKCPEDVFLGSYIIALGYVKRHHITVTEPLPIRLLPACRFLLHLLEELHRPHRLHMIVEVVLHQLVGVIKILRESKLIGHLFQFLLPLENEFILFGRG